jgi:hypothetical protein
MPILQILIVPCLVLAVAAVLLGWELRGWRAARREALPAEERDHRRRRFRRRMQANGMLAIVAVLMAAGSVVSWERYPSTYVSIWVAVFVLVVWLILLALADAAVSLHRGRRAQQHLLAEQARLEAEVRSNARGRR